MISRQLFYIHRNIFKNWSKMSTFAQKLNPITGTIDWVVQDANYDYHQEIARAAFADMLHDTERNQKYEQALKIAIDKVHSNGKKANVLDIGTGTGLLSMMAVRNGADSVTACEAFKPMGECAKQVIAQNGYADRIKVIPKISFDVTVGEKEDMEKRCNILVTEVFDTELIGEGALSIFLHAVENLCEPDSIIIPQSANLYVQVVESPVAQNWNRIKDVFNDEGKLLVKVPEAIKKCAGSSAVHDIQLSQFPRTSFNTIISPTPICTFNWSSSIPFKRLHSVETRIERDGKAQVVFMWWDLQMDCEERILLSCAPVWAHPEAKMKPAEEIPWRDHWMQGVYYLPQEIDVKKDEKYIVHCGVDEYSLCFNMESVKSSVITSTLEPPICNCGLHISFSRTRIGQMNDSRRIKKYLALFEEHLDKDSSILVLGDSFYSALAAAKLGVKKMYFLELNKISRGILLDYINANDVENVKIVESLDELKATDISDVNVVLAEPYFTSSILPWDNLRVLYLFREIRDQLSRDIIIFPKRAVIKAVPVHFKDLYKIRSPLDTCEGFTMDAFDKLIERSSKVDDIVEAQPLWEYPGVALSEVQELLSISLIDTTEKAEYDGSFNIKSDLVCNGIALWIDWYLTDSTKSSITTGPISPVVIGEKIDWDMHTRQGVSLFPGKLVTQIDYSFSINFKEGNIIFKCN
ncbi:protein arginine N-methyltransferase 7 [Diabrotica undecimpunctata]|uniref:protein arginine N-methyltransferase 7 n=1 Tax=Diabrotica undecimpunctata TaxID=50387 RepID=UPI003B637EBB